MARQEADGEGAALNKMGRASWGMVLIIAGIIGGFIFVVNIDAVQATRIADERVAMRVGPLENRFLIHETKDEAMQKALLYERQSINEVLTRIERQQMALCRASSRPQICLGGE
jgi:hypothetical protein